MTRRLRGRIIFAKLSAVVFALACTWTPERVQVSNLSYVNLSYSAPGAIHHRDGPWTVTGRARKLQGGDSESLPWKDLTCTGHPRTGQT
jgi:hypothetical protein